MNIIDIAKMAGVSKSTVSRYLNGGSISLKTKQKIDKIVEETGYTPSQFAKSLKAKHTEMIGVIVPRLNSYASNETLHGIETYLRDIHYQTIIVNTDLEPLREIEALKTLAKNKVDGIILLATVISEELINTIKSINIPVLIVGQSHQEVHSIVQNDYEAGCLIGEYFGKLSFEKLAYLGVTDKDKAVGIHRKRGVMEGLSHFNKKADVYETSFNLKETSVIAEKIVQNYDAVICATDNIALGSLLASQKNNIQVPQQLSLSGFGGYETVQLVTPSITTIAFPYKETGERAAKTIISLIKGEEVDQLQVMDFQLIENNSIDKNKCKK